MHPASAVERAQAFHNLHDTWGRGLSAADHLAWRLSFPKHRNAVWYVGCLQGGVVTGCGAYDFRVQLGSTVHEACAFGEVHTIAALRGRGLAARLLAGAEDDQRRRGKTLALLYSDIAPAYYERLGYVTCPSLAGWADRLDHRSAPDPPAGGVELRPCDPWRDLHELGAFYDLHHSALPLRVARSPAYWEYLVARAPSDEIFWAVDGGERAGYVRLAATADEVKIRELVAAGQNAAEAIYTAVLRLARARGIDRAGGWMPSTPATRARFQITARRTEITMLKPLAASVSIEPRHRDAAAWLHEIDHV